METEFQKQGHVRIKVALDLESEGSALPLAPCAPPLSAGNLCLPLERDAIVGLRLWVRMK